MRFIYLHGFASSPQSHKAQTLRDFLAARGVRLEIPDLAAGRFAHLTISGQLRLIESLLDGAPCRLIGSSMGGYLAAIYAATHPEVDRLVLLGPAFGFARRWRELQSKAINKWRETGWLEVYHYGENAIRQVHFGLFEDALSFEGFPDFRQPTLIFHGVADATVPIEFSRQVARSHPNVDLRELQSDHGLLDALGSIIAESTEFLTHGEHFPV